MRFFLFYASLIIGVSACREDFVNDAIKVDFTPRIPEIALTKVIPLETREDALLDNSYHIHSTANYYVAHDGSKILVYDKSGKINRIITPIGRGPNEVVRLVNIWPDENSIKILDINTNRIIEYDYEGKFLQAIALDYRPMDFCIFNGHYLFDLQGGELKNGHVLAISDTKGDIIKSGVGIIAEKLFYGAEKFQTQKNHTLYLPSHSNTVYSIDTANNIENHYSFDFGKHWADKSIAEYYKNPKYVFDFWKYLQYNDMIGFLKFKETEDVIFLNFEKVDAVYNWFYIKNNGDQYLVKVNDNQKSVAGSKILCVEGNSFIFEIPALNYRDYPDLPQLDIEESDNPVLLIGHLIS